jgi:flagellar protein FlbD
MIKLTRITEEEFFLNPEVIRSVEEAGDTVLTLTTGEKILVKERPDEIAEAFVRYKQAIHQGMELPFRTAASASL